MSFPEIKIVDLPSDVGGNPIVAIGEIVEVNQLYDKGYEVVYGVGATFTGDLEASVALLNWTPIADLTVTAQGGISPQYNFVRANIRGAGAIGTGTSVRVAGKSDN